MSREFCVPAHAVNDHEIGGLQELADFDPAERRRRGHALETP